MNKNVINNYRMGGYLLIAIGLINLRYQSGQGSVLQHSLTILIPGAIVLISTFIPAIAKNLHGKAMQAVSIAVGLLLIAYAVIN
jgi:hypothetical protein